MDCNYAFKARGAMAVAKPIGQASFASSGGGHSGGEGGVEEVNVALMPDRLHPNAAGFASILRCVSDAMS